MKKLIVAVMIVAFAAASAFAAQDVVKFENKKGTVTFNHKAHGEKLGCESCHEGEPAKIEINKSTAHKKLCKDCHKKMKQGPTKCKACHVK